MSLANPAATQTGTQPEKTTWQRVARRIRVPMGFVTAAVFLLLAHPTPHTLLFSLTLVAPGLALRAYASGYVKKNSELTITGPYGYTRNPLYLGSMLITAGFAAAAGSWILLVGLLALFWAIYLPTILNEEQFLRSTFPGFATYCARVPRIWPRLWRRPRPTDADGSFGRFSAALYRRHHEYNATIGVCAIYLALGLRLLYFRMRS